MQDDLAEKLRVDATVGGCVERHAAEARFEHAQRDHAVLHFLLRDGDGRDVALATIVERDLRRGVAQVFETERLADIRGELRRERLGRDQEIAGETESRDDDLRAFRLGEFDLGRRRGRTDVGQTGRRKTPLNLIKQTTGIRGGLGGNLCVTNRQQGARGPE